MTNPRRHPDYAPVAVPVPATYAPSLGTNFNYRIDLASLEAVCAFGFQWARIDGQTSDPDTLAAMVDDADKAALHPLPIVYDLDRLDALGVHPSVVDVEWGNEPDGDILPSTYRTQLDRACEHAAYFHLRLWAPALSNLDRDSLYWLERVRGLGWPPGLYGISVHRYGDGTFEWPHDGFASRDDEVRRLLELCDGLPFIVTEFGYPSGGAARTGARRERFLQPGLQLSETEQAARISQEWAFWRAYTPIAALYQINDGPEPDQPQYGIRRCLPDGTLTDWKPSAYTVPKEEIPMPDDTGTATYCISRTGSVASTGRPGAFHTYYPKGQTETILSIQPDGRKETRPVTAAGAWETWVPSPDGNRAIFDQTAESYAIPLVD